MSSLKTRHRALKKGSTTAQKVRRLQRPRSVRDLFMRAFANLTNQEIGDAIEALIDMLDSRTPDPDLEPEWDGCEAFDDCLTNLPGILFGDGLPGDPDDAELEEDRCEACDDDPGPLVNFIPRVRMLGGVAIISSTAGAAI